MIKLVLMFIAGVLSKIVDLISDDELKLFKYADIMLGLAYGLALFFVITSSDSMVTGLLLATLLGVLIMGKIDSVGHGFGAGVPLSLLMIYGLPPIDVGFFTLFLIVCIIEEWSNDLKIENALLHRVVDARPLLELTSLAITLLTHNPLVWLTLLSYDLGYQLVNQVWKNK